MYNFDVFTSLLGKLFVVLIGVKITLTLAVNKDCASFKNPIKKLQIECF